MLGGIKSLLYALNVRTTPNFDSSSNILGVAYLGECFEVLETTDDYVKIVFKGQQAFIVANPSYISFDHPLIEKGVTQ